MANVVIKDYDGNDKTYENAEKVRLRMAEGGKQIYSKGDAVENVAIALDFSEGDQTVTPDEGTLIKSAIIAKPETLIPENIVKDIEIAGVVGTSQGGGMPMFPPGTIGTSTVDGLKRIAVYDNANNGIFSRQVQIISDDKSVVFAESAVITGSGYLYFYGYQFLSKPNAQPFNVSSRMTGDGFASSELLALAEDLFLVSILRNLVGCNLDKDYQWLFSGDQIAFNLTPEEGYFFPRAILIEPSEGEIVYSYNALTGAIIFTLPEVSSISITAEAPTIPWLQTPTVTWADTIATVEPVDNVTHLEIYINDELADTKGVSYAESSVSESLDVSIAKVGTVSGASYGFSLNSSGYYVSGNKGINSSYALCKLTITSEVACTLTLACINYAENNYDFGILSNLDTTLSLSYTVDSSNVYKSFKGLSSSSVQYVAYDVPAGEHFIYIKFRKDSSAHSNNDTLQFKVSSITTTKVVTAPSTTTVDMLEYLDSYGTYNVSIVATAEGYTSSDPVEHTVTLLPTIQISNAVMTVTKILNGATMEIYVDDECIDVLDCAGIESTEVALIQYGVSIAAHTVYITITDTNGNVTKSNVVSDAICFACSSFAEADWAEIDAVSQAGLASQVYAVGDTRTITFNSESIKIAIAGFDHDDLADGSGKAGISIVCMSVPSTTVAWGSSAFYQNAAIKTTVNNWKSYLPSELASVIKTVTKVCDASYDSGTKTTTTCNCDLWLLSHQELGIAHTTNYYANLGSRYPLFTAKTVSTTYATGLPTVTTTTTTTTVAYWTRQIKHIGVLQVSYAQTSGNDNTVNSNFASTYYAARFGFCI